nr:protein FAR1-RELATED SEQUENCE 5-like [Ipomoea batatas]
MGEDAMDATAQEAQSDDRGCMENNKGEFECEMETSLDGTKQWLPQASPEQTPYVGQKFKTAEEGILFYQEYAKAAGFDVRHSTMRKTRNGEVAIKYMVCSREGFKPVNIRKTNAVFKNEGVDEIPVEYIVGRWTRDACTRPIHDIWWATTANSQGGNAVSSVANQLWNEFYNCLGLVNGWQEKMEEMLTTLQQLKKGFHKERQQSKNPDSTIESILGSKPAGEVHIKPPKVANNKGRGKRLKSNKEKAMQKVKKKPRVCATCGGTNHDSRNCEEYNTYEED